MTKGAVAGIFAPYVGKWRQILQEMIVNWFTELEQRMALMQ